MNLTRAHCFILSMGALLLIGGPLGVGAPPLGSAGAEGLQKYNSPYYDVYTDVEPDLAREAIVRMTRMAEEYHERTKGLFAGTINQKLPFYMFSRLEDYNAAGGPPGSAGVFMSNGAQSRLMAVLTRGRGGVIDAFTWHTIQHEGFHQFVHYVVRGDIPIWVNEGMAEYFGEGIFTGDGMVTGVVPPARCKRIKAEIAGDKFKSINQMMHTESREWLSEMSVVNYDQAWSMCQFLSHGENGRYQNAFASYMQGIGRGQSPNTAWETNFGGAAGFEDKWREYWLNLPENATRDLYAKSVVATLTSYIGRATSQKQAFADFDQFIGTDVSALTMNYTDWLPHRLFTDAVRRAKGLESDGYAFALVPKSNKQPMVVCTTPAGQKIIGTFRLNGSRMSEPSPVTVEMTKSLAPKSARP